MNLKQALSPNKLLLAIPVIGMFAFYMWQPISDYFLTGSFNDNVVLLLESEAIKVDDAKQILVLHIKPQNAGKTPVVITDKGKSGRFTVEIRKIENLQDARFLDFKSMPIVNSTDILRQHKDGYSIEAGAYYDEVEAITLPLGFYWVNAKLTFSDGDYVDQSLVVKLTNEKAI